MTFVKNLMTYAARTALIDNAALRYKVLGENVEVHPFDPELLYVECHKCGKPVLWESGQTTKLVDSANIDTSQLDERCMVLSEGCPVCTPEANGEYPVSIVRVAGLSPDEAVHMLRPGGNA